MERTIKRKLLLLLMAILLVLLTITSLKASAEDSNSNGTSLNDWEYTETEDTIILIRYKGSSKDVVVPGSFPDTNKKVRINYPRIVFSSKMSSITSLKIGTPEQKVGIEGENMGFQFGNMWRDVVSIDLSGLDTSNVTSMVGMFHNCPKLINLNLSGLDTSKVTDMTYMFSYCPNLISVDMSSFDMSHVLKMVDMFASCSSLTSVKINRFDTSAISTMQGIFSGCNNLTSLDVSNFDTSNVMKTEYMFSNCYNMHYFDLSRWDLTKVSKYTRMFWVTSNIVDEIDTIIKCSDENEQKLKEICEDSTVLANRKVSEYPKYIANGGTYEDGSIEKQCFDSIIVNESKIPTTQKEVCEYFDTPKKADKIFDGWYLEPDCKTRYVSDNTSLDINAVIRDGLTLYAGWRDPEVSYEFVSGTEGKELPEEIKNLLPESITCEIGDKLKPANLAQTTVSVTGGSWNFVGYDADEKEVIGDITFTGTWVYNSAPIITASDKTIIVGDIFDLMEGMSAIDEEDGDLTEDVQIIVNNVNPNKEGTYQMTYQVTDSGGITVTKTIHVTVNKKDEPIITESSENNNKPTITVDTNQYHNKVVENKIQTSDNTDIMMWLTMIVLSNGCIVWMKRKRNVN